MYHFNQFRRSLISYYVPMLGKREHFLDKLRARHDFYNICLVSHQPKESELEILLQILFKSAFKSFFNKEDDFSVEQQGGTLVFQGSN